MKTKFPRADALKVAKQLCDELTPHCERIVVAGSLRRGAQEVGDVEILYIPKIVEGVRTDMFSDPPFVHATEMPIACLLGTCVLSKRQNINGHTAGWGPKNKLAVHVASGIPVDFFATTPEEWWVALVIRTGPKDFNLKLTTGALRRRLTLHAYGTGVEDKDGNITDATSEEHVCQLCGVPYAEPKDRR